MSEEYDVIIERQRKEKKDLREKIIALKRSEKGSKKDKKKLQDEIAQMEKELIDKHAEELSKLKIEEDNPVEEVDEASKSDDGNARKSKAQRRRERKEQDNKRRESDIQQGEEANKTSARQLESKAINRILKSRNLVLYHIKSDGDCLYNAIRHQLEFYGIYHSVESLRKISADYIRANKDELIFYMPSSRGDDIMSQEEFDEYCDQVENTKAWGSQIEIQALSNSLKLKIEILQSEGRPTISGENSKIHLIVTYHRHFYGLGEHYNSTSSKATNNDHNHQNDHHN
jgi:OTU domain-containing protein 6